MNITVTNIKKIYDKKKLKILLTENGVLESDFLTNDEIFNLNIDFAKDKNKIHENTLVEIKNLYHKIIKENLLEKHELLDPSKTTFIFGILYQIGLNYTTKSNIVKNYISNILKILENSPYCSNKIKILTDFKIKDFTSYKIPNYLNFKSIKYYNYNVKLKLIYYFLWDFFYKINPKQNQKKHILFIINNIEHHYKIIEPILLNIKKSNEFHPILILYPNSLGNLSSRSNRIKDVEVYDFHKFKTLCFNKTNIYNKSKFILNYYPTYMHQEVKTVIKNNLLNYSWMIKIYNIFQPVKVINVGTHQLGRIVSDTASVFNIPSYSIDYAMFSNSPFLDTNIKFDYKLTTGKYASYIWKKRNDPSIHNIPVGFINLDEQNGISIDNKEAFFNKFNLSINKKTILFLSYPSYNNKDIFYVEKYKIIEFLDNLCYINDWNLIIKKHPLEFETIESNISFKKQKFIEFNNNEISLNKIIFYSDFLITQMSSTVFESIYYNKPLVFFSYSSIEHIKKTIEIATNLTFYCDSNYELEKLIVDYFNSKCQEISFDERKYYIENIDSNAKDNILNIVLK